MATIIFYEKPGCLGNKAQKALLRAAGHSLEVRDLLATPWTEASLSSFFEGLAVSTWFNRSAPPIKRGDFDPDAIGAEEALRRMIEQPILIRRPLMESEGARMVGFETALVDRWIGLGDHIGNEKNLEGCVRESWR